MKRALWLLLGAVAITSGALVARGADKAAENPPEEKKPTAEAPKDDAPASDEKAPAEKAPAEKPVADGPKAPGAPKENVPKENAPKENAPKGNEPKFKGQSDLDAAIADKVTAQSFKDLEKVVQQGERAIRLGLDKPNMEFAKMLVASTRIERSTKISQAIFNPEGPDPQWAQIRKLALTDLDLALAYDPNNAEGQLLKARLNALPGGDPKQATNAVEAAVRLGEGNPVLKSQALLLRGDMASDKELKLADYDEALKLQPENVIALRSRGFFHMVNDHLPLAKTDLEKAAQLDDDSAPTHEALGLVLMLLKDYKASLKQLNRAVEIAPNDASARGNRARVLAINGENDKALEDIQKAMKLAPENMGLLLLRANILRQAGRRDEALADVDKLISKRPNLVEAVRVRAHILASADKIPQAIGELERALESAPDDVELSIDLAMFYAADKKPKRAIALYDKILARGAKVAQLYRGRGDAYLGLGEQRKAVEDYEAALKLDPKDSGLLNNLAWVLATSPDDSLRDGKRAIDLATQACEETQFKAAHILSTLAAAYAEAGDFKMAIKWSQKSLDVNDDKTVGDSLKTELSNYKAGKPTRELKTEESKDDSPELPKSSSEKREEKPAKEPAAVPDNGNAKT